MKLGILRADFIGERYSDEFGEYPDMFMDLLGEYVSNLEIVVYEIRDGEYPNNIDDVDAYLLTGSEDSAYDNLEWFPRLTKFICELHENRKKLIGICFGHQFIAQALGGKVVRSPNGLGMGRHVVTLNDAKEFGIMTHHQDQVISPAEGAVIIGGSEFCPISVCTIGEHILTFQGHPEFTKSFSVDMLNRDREKIGEDVYQQVVVSFEKPFDTKFVAKWIADVICK